MGGSVNRSWLARNAAYVRGHSVAIREVYCCLLILPDPAPRIQVHKGTVIHAALGVAAWFSPAACFFPAALGVSRGMSQPTKMQLTAGSMTGFQVVAGVFGAISYLDDVHLWSWDARRLSGLCTSELICKAL